MKCGAARRIAWPDGAPRAVDEAVASAAEHIDECPACRKFVADMREVAERLSASRQHVSAPREVRERLFAALSRVRSESDRTLVRRATSFRFAGVAAIALMALMMAVWRFSSPHSTPQSEVAPALADDHSRELQSDGIASDRVSDVTHWLASRVGFAVHAASFANGRLVGARVADVNGHRGAVLLYRVDGQAVSYYIFPTPGTGTGEWRLRQPGVNVSSWNGFHVAAWEEPGLTHALVGDLPAARLMVLAHECIAQMV